MVEDDDGGTLALFRDAAANSAPCRTGRPTTAIIRTDSLNSLDQVAVATVERLPGLTRIALDIRRHVGPIAANVPWFALIRIPIGLPSTGLNEIVLSEIVTEIGDKAGAQSPTTCEQHLSFHCD
ncbi:hypothetical protein Q4F19_17215 [Sphingomonas sp. BIUV-7]|uniref:Uncharacterized protein n=1 Tax=Sphingomonas natans TaxID=3063330 RepID=A0ABT8YEN5_9SPHN|nr:hypothetical protein [Sphingomonas sp. BIUV-7]MDO6416129.1 hypothetical protein [Sphingomonas sp. BIUV-7]